MLNIAKERKIIKIKVWKSEKKYERDQIKTFLTGGGPSQKSFEPSSDLEAQLFNAIHISVEGVPCELGSDAVVNK